MDAAAPDWHLHKEPVRGDARAWRTNFGYDSFCYPGKHAYVRDGDSLLPSRNDPYDFVPGDTSMGGLHVHAINNIHSNTCRMP